MTVNRFLPAFLLFLVLSPGCDARAQPQAIDTGATLPAKIARLEHTSALRAAKEATRPVDVGLLVERLYGTSQSALLWLGSDRRQARRALALLQTAGEHGLVAADYRAEELSRQLDNLTAGGEARFDLALSASFLQFLADLRYGRIRPDYMTPAPETQLAQFDPVEHLQRALREDHLEQAVEQALPPIPLYLRVKETLAHYRRLAGAAHQALPLAPIRGAAKLTPGSRYEGAAILGDRLRLLGDLVVKSGSESENIYTKQLSDAVKRFQSRHGLAEDGALGPATMAALSVPLEHRVRQLELTLERLRWVPALRPGRLVVVNVAAFRLWAFDTANPGSSEPLEMRVIVGKAAGTPTPLFIGQMRYLEFNPYWNVPLSIEKTEILPKLARNPAYLKQNGMELVSRSGKVQSAGGAGALAALRSGTVRVRQRPGAHNVLGAVKFAMPNPMNIYLHSTSARELFSRTRRDLSHGCIRVERPAELAEFVLADQMRWNAERVRAAMQPGPTRTVQLKVVVPVVLFYATAGTDRRGRALFSEDIYRRDAKLIRALGARQGRLGNHVDP